MSSCTSCGHQLGLGRFCTNCGAPVDAPVAAAEDDWRTDTAERGLPTVDPRTPPAAVAPPPPPRYPLYADQVVGYTPYGPVAPVGADTGATATHAAEPELLGPGVADPDHESGYDETGYETGYLLDPSPDQVAYDPYDGTERRSPVLWILAAAMALVLVGAGWWLLARDDRSSQARDDGSPSAAGTKESAGVDVAARASVKAPSTAPPNEDVNGDQVSYDASNMLDGVPETAWRTAGDGKGLTLTFTLRSPTTLHQVGLVNGYAKTSVDGKGRTFDWYHGNRRIQTVTWVFDDGTKVRQQLEDDTALQLVDVPDVTTGKVLLRLVRVSAPGKGAAARDFTAISEVSLIGDPQA